MPKNKDWLPGKREDQLAMAKQWRGALVEPGPDSHPYFEMWGMPEADVDDLALLAANAEDALIRVKNTADRTHVTVVNCNEAFKALVAKMRYIKKRFFYVPPLTEADIARLGLNPEDMEPTPIHAPTAQPEADIAFPGIHLVELRNIRPSAAGMPPDPRSDYRAVIHYGLTGMPTETHHFRIADEPKSGHELPDHVPTRRKHYLFDFDGESGNTVYFCLRYENEKGDAGPFGPIAKAVIP